MVVIIPGAKDTLLEWRSDEREFLDDLLEGLVSWYQFFATNQNDTCKAIIEDLRAKLGELIGSQLPWKHIPEVGEVFNPLDHLLNYWNFLKCLLENQIMFLTLWVEPPDLIPPYLQDYYDQALLDFLGKNPTVHYDVEPDQAAYIRGLLDIELKLWFKRCPQCGYVIPIFDPTKEYYDCPQCGKATQYTKALLRDRIYYKPSTIVNKARLIKFRRGQRWTIIDPIFQSFKAVYEEKAKQRARLAASRRGTAYQVIPGARNLASGYISKKQLLMYAERAYGASMWKQLTKAQRRPFRALAFGERLIEWMRNPPAQPTDKAAALPNTLNKTYLMFLREYWAYFQRTNKALPWPVENIIKLYYPDRSPAAYVMLIMDCAYSYQPIIAKQYKDTYWKVVQEEGKTIYRGDITFRYAPPILVEFTNEDGKCYESATCPHVDPNKIFILPYGLGCQHWDEYTSQQIANDIAEQRPPVIAHDFRIYSQTRALMLYSQDPREWAYTGTWPSITRYLGISADVRILTWGPWEKGVEVEVWRGSSDEVIDVYWGRLLLGTLYTGDQALTPDLALARFIIHYNSYHDFQVEVLWWARTVMPTFIPSATEAWGYIEPPQYQLLLVETWSGEIEFDWFMTESWDYDPSGPILLKMKYYENWNYTQPPPYTQLLIEQWSS